MQRTSFSLLSRKTQHFGKTSVIYYGVQRRTNWLQPALKGSAKSCGAFRLTCCERKKLCEPARPWLLVVVRHPDASNTRTHNRNFS